MNIKKHFLITLIMVALMIFGVGCEVGVNPLLFDGTPVDAVFHVNTNGTTYNGTKTINLNDIFNAIGNSIDSVRLFNITVMIDNADSTPSGTKVSGSAMASGYTVVRLDTVDVTALATEKSIFDPSFTNFHLDTAGVHSLVLLIADAFQHRDVNHDTKFAIVNGSASDSPLKFDIHVKVYTQVFTHTN